MDVAAYLQEFTTEATGHGFATQNLAAPGAPPLPAFTRPGSGPTIYLSAGLHGDEPAGCLALLELLKTGVFANHANWRLCPAVNTTGLELNTRENAKGQDLNRDYLARQTSEVRAHGAWLDSLSTPDLFLSLHEDWESIGFYLYEINTTQKPSFAHLILDAVRPIFPPEPASLIDDHEVSGPGWIYHADEPDFPDEWPEAIYMAKKGCPLSFTFETPSSASLEKRVSAHLVAVKTALMC